MKINKAKLVEMVREEVRNLDLVLTERAKSKAQQALFSQVYDLQKGGRGGDSYPPKVKKLAATMDPEAVEDFASTPTSDLPDEVDVEGCKVDEEYKHHYVGTPEGKKAIDAFLRSMKTLGSSTTDKLKESADDIAEEIINILESIV